MKHHHPWIPRAGAYRPYFFFVRMLVLQWGVHLDFHDTTVSLPKYLKDPERHLGKLPP